MQHGTEENDAQAEHGDVKRRSEEALDIHREADDREEHHTEEQAEIHGASQLLHSRYLCDDDRKR